MQFTPLPNLFFSTLLPQISDIAELKTTLHIFEALYHKRGYPRFVTYRELLANTSLISSLREAEKPPDEALRQALEMATKRGVVLHMVFDRDGVPEDIYFLNTEYDRKIVAKIQSGELILSGLKAKEKAYVEIEEQPDIFTLYEQNIGMLTPMIAEELREAEKLYPEAWIRDAIKEAVSLNKRNWRYIARILERWLAEGRSNGTYKREILKRGQAQINTSNRNMDTWSSTEQPEETPGPVCPICKGAGFVHPLLSSGKPDFSRVVACRCTRGELDKERQTRSQRYSNLGSLTRLTFDNLLPQGRSGNPINQEQFSRAYEAARAFATEPKGWLVLVGPSGCGKTHLAAAIANEHLSRGYPVFFITPPALLDHLRSTFSPNSEIPYDELFEQVRNAPLLVLDDLGAQTGTPWAKEKLEQLLNHRFNSELPTVIVTIIPIEQLEERIRTRLADPRLCQIYAVEEKQPSLEYGWGPEFELQKSMTFANFDWRRVNLLPEQRENLEQAFRLALDFAKSPEGWLVLQGVTGCGKTHLAAAIANYRLQAGKPALFIVVPDFLDHLRSTFSPESKVSYDQYFESVKNAPLLILDDFGEQSTTPWAQEKLYQVINYRYNARLATVVTMRCTTDEIDSPISSRFVDPKISMIFNIRVPDYRGDLPPTQRTKTYRRGKKDRWS